MLDKIKLKATNEIVYCKSKYDKEKKEWYFYNAKDETVMYNKDDFDYIPQEPYELFGVECGEGWKSLYEPIIKYIENYNKDKKDEDKIIIQQIKEKFAELRIYVSSAPQELRDMIDKATEQSYFVCERCGNTEDGGTISDGWLYSSCKKCAQEYANKVKRDIKWRSAKDEQIYVITPEKVS